MPSRVGQIKLNGRGNGTQQLKNTAKDLSFGVNKGPFLDAFGHGYVALIYLLVGGIQQFGQIVGYRQIGQVNGAPKIGIIDI